MSTLKILSPGDEGSAILRRPADRVREFGAELHLLLDDMRDTMHTAAGVGSAAPQVGRGIRATVVEYPEDEEAPEETMRLFELINPEILRSRGAEMGQEGCLSLPGLAADVERATYVLVRAQDRHGKEFRIKAYDWLARIFQHEIDHLHGILMIDRSDQLYRLLENEEGEIEAVPITELLDS